MDAINIKLDIFDNKVENKMENIETKMVISQKEIFSNIENLKEEMRVLKKIFKKSDNKLLCEIPKESALPPLPINSVDDLIKLDGLIKNSKSESTLLTTTLADVGGPKFSSVCHNIMKTLISKEVAQQYSLKGKGLKLAFIDTAVYKCVIGKSNINDINKIVDFLDFDK